jgi:membrane protein implicated in regulation of membrane protease activity
VDADTSTDAHHIDSSWMFAVLSFRTIVAALAFFGLGGLAAQSAEASQPVVLVVAMAAGLAAMFAVYWMMRGLMSLKAEGTARVERAIGGHGTVYVTIPAEESGQGKIQLNVQGRTMEYAALTSGHALSPGTQIVVTDILNSDTVEVKPILESDE